MGVRVKWVDTSACDNIFFLKVSILRSDDICSHYDVTKIIIDTTIILTEFNQMLGVTIFVMMYILWTLISYRGGWISISTCSNSSYCMLQ